LARWWRLILASPFLCIACWALFTAARWSLARSWPAVPCVISASSVEEVGGNRPYVFSVRYRYTWAGGQYEGWTDQKDFKGSSDIADAERRARAFPTGSHCVCYVNPDHPTEAVLEFDNVWLPIAGAVFALHYSAFFVLKGRAQWAAIGSFFALAGLGCYVGFFALPLWRALRSQGWPATPCAVQSGCVRSERHQYETTYWPDVVYCYDVNGVTYRANTWNASDVGSPWYYGARGVVRRQPPGIVTTCYVNPSDPSEAVLTRSLSSTQWFGVWPLAMIVMGVSEVIVSITGRWIKVGRPRFWGTLALGAATTSSLTVLWITGADLLRDYREGFADWPEFVSVAVAGLFSAALTAFWVSLAAHRRGRVAATVPSVIWDGEIDRAPKRKGGR
jgi:hypothetical protein